MNTEIDSEPLAVLAAYLEVDPEDLEEQEWGHYGLSLFADTVHEWAIGTDEEANAACLAYCEETLWAFKASFLLGYMTAGLREKDIETIQERCEDANPAIRALVGESLSWLVRDAIGADGRGHFLSSYDGNEIEAQGFYIYRIN